MPRHDPMVPEHGQVIAGSFVLERLLGRGAMGLVWLARHRRLDSLVAIKLMIAAAARSAAARLRFDREAKLVARIRSRHVPTMLDHGTTEDGTSYIVMDYLEGETLRTRLDREGRISNQATARVIAHVCRALTAAHAAGLVHRDLKPDNVFAAREDGDEVFKVLDFGVAKVTDLMAMEGLDPTKTGTMLGTPHYMSPEQAVGLKNVDHRSDLWSVGVLAYECLTGSLPFAAPALGPLIAKVLHGAVTPPSQLAADNVPPEVDGWMLKALCRDLEGRHQSAIALSESFMVAARAMDSIGHAAKPQPAIDPARLGAADTLMLGDDEDS